MTPDTENRFGTDGLLESPSANTRIFRSPGRVNIIGEHTDYTGGFVLPTTTTLYIWSAATVRDDRVVNLTSLNLDDEQSFRLDDSERSSGWASYVQGVARLIEKSGIKLRGADIAIDSEIPIGGGLSSSAALEVVIARTLLATSSAEMSDVDIARLCQRAEVEFAGVNCGLMDQYAVACCPRNHAVLLDCNNVDARNIALPESIRFLVTDCGVRHQLSDGGFNQRARECADAVRILTEHVPGFSLLRHLREADLAAHQAILGDTLLRRCRHVVSENHRVLEVCDALESGNVDVLGDVFAASHRSLKNDFEVSCVELDELVELADRTPGVLGSRMIGAGFGGCVLSVVESDCIEQAAASIRKDYAAINGTEPWMHVVAPADPAMETDSR